MKPFNLLASIFALLLITSMPAFAKYQWISSSKGNIPPNAFQVGAEKDKTPLYLCRIHDKTKGVQPGKVVNKNCNIPYGGKELQYEIYEVLTGSGPTEWNQVIGPGGERINFQIGATWNIQGTGLLPEHPWPDRPWWKKIGELPTLPRDSHLDYIKAFVVGHEVDPNQPLLLCRVNDYTPLEWFTRHWGLTRSLEWLLTKNRGTHPGKLVNGNCNISYGGKEIVWPYDFEILTIFGQIE